MISKKYVQMSDDCIFELKKWYKTLCCDCGLVHLWEFKMIKGKPFFRIRRDNRATAQMRKNHKYDKR